MEPIFKITKFTTNHLLKNKDDYNNTYKSFIISKNGNLNIEIGSEKHLCQSPCIIYLPDNLKYTISSDEDVELWRIDFTTIFFTDFFFEIQQYYSDLNYLNFENKPCFVNIISICEMLDYEYNQKVVNHNILYNLWNSLFVIFKSEQFKKEDVIKSDKNHYFKEFLNLLEDNYKLNPTPEFYSSKLIISARQLNKIVNEFVGKSISNLITARKMIEAKRELMNTNKHISEIGFDLGYTEKSYFSKVFKNYYGITPSELKRQFNI